MTLNGNIYEVGQDSQLFDVSTHTKKTLILGWRTVQILSHSAIEKAQATSQFRQCSYL